MRREYNLIKRITISFLCIAMIYGNYSVNAKEIFSKENFKGSEYSPLIKGESQIAYNKSSSDEKVIDKEINISKDRSSYGSNDENQLMSISKNINVTGSDVTLKNLKINGNVTVTGKDVSLLNVKIDGNLVINPGDKSGATLYRVEVDNIEVFSLATNSCNYYDSLYFRTVKSKTLNIYSRNTIEPIKIYLKGRSSIEKTEIKSSVIIDYEDGFSSCGNIEIVQNLYNHETVLKVKGPVDKEIRIKAKASIIGEEWYKIPKVIIENPNEEKTTLQGYFGDIKIDAKSSIHLIEESYVTTCDVYKDTKVELDKNSYINSVVTNKCEIIKSGDGKINCLCVVK